MYSSAQLLCLCCIAALFLVCDAFQNAHNIDLTPLCTRSLKRAYRRKGTSNAGSRTSKQASEQSSSTWEGIADVIFKDSVGETITKGSSLSSSSLSSVSPDYVYIPPEVGPEIYIGSIVALIPIVWATYEFTSRIRVQQQCLVCSGTGLVSLTKSGNALKRQRKCYNCGGFLPWLGWKAFFLSTFDVGNGGVLQRPSPSYKETNERLKLEAEAKEAKENEE